MRLLALALTALLMAGCHSGGGTVPWLDDDGTVVSPNAPDNRDLPAPRKDSFRALEVRVLLQSRRPDPFDSPELGAVIDPLPLAGPEPLDLDLVVTLDARDDRPASYRARLTRTYVPSAPSGELSVEWKSIWSDFTVAKPERLTEFWRDGPAGRESVSGTFHQEGSLVSRAKYRNGGYVMVVRFRNRLESEHRDWKVKDTKVLIEWEDGAELALPAFVATPRQSE